MAERATHGGQAGPGSSPRSALPLEPSRLPASQEALRTQLERDVRTLAVDLGERNLRDAPRFFHLERAAGFIEEALRGAGLRVARQPFRAGVLGVRTLEAELQGTSSPDEVVIVAARYDCAHESAGANDNATGVAALLALARAWAGAGAAARTVRFVALPTGRHTPQPAAPRYAARLREQGTQVRGVLSLEALGRSSAAPARRTPPLMVVGNLASRRLARTVTWALAQGEVPGRAAFVPGGLPGMGASDPGAFWQQRIPAVRVTEVFPLSAWRADERVEQLDFARLTHVVRGLEHVLAHLAHGEH
jgi:Peptidase family M28